MFAHYFWKYNCGQCCSTAQDEVAFKKVSTVGIPFCCHHVSEEKTTNIESVKSLNTNRGQWCFSSSAFFFAPSLLKTSHFGGGGGYFSKGSHEFGSVYACVLSLLLQQRRPSPKRISRPITRIFLFRFMTSWDHPALLTV